MARITASVLIGTALADGTVRLTRGGVASEANDVYLSWDNTKVTTLTQLDQALRELRAIASSSLK